LLIALLLATSAAAWAAAPSPVIIIPGDGGCQLEARLLGKPKVKHWWCSKDSGWFRLWLDVKQLLPGQVDCWADNMRQVYNPGAPGTTNSSSYSDAPGVEVRVVGWGDTSSVEYLDPVVRTGDSVMFGEVVEALVGAGAVRGESVRAAPYDFRRIPGAEYHAALRALVEDTVSANGGTPAALLSHSMGCLVTSRFLAAMPPAWKAAHVAQWLGVSCAFGGSARLLRLYANGDNLGVSAVSPAAIRGEQRSSEANFWLLPVPEVFGDAVLATTPARNYTAAQLGAFFADIGFPEGRGQYERVRALTAGALAPPGVPFTHFYGTGLDTPVQHTWSSADFKKQPKVAENADGDGTLSWRSLSAVEDAWAGAYTAREYPGKEHTSILRDGQFLDDMLAAAGWAEEGGSAKPSSFLRLARGHYHYRR